MVFVILLTSCQQQSDLKFEELHLYNSFPIPKNSELLEENDEKVVLKYKLDQSALSRIYSYELLNRSWFLYSSESNKVYYVYKDDLYLRVVISKSASNKYSLVTINKINKAQFEQNIK